MNRQSFELHSRLTADCVHLGDLVLCRVLLMKDRRFPWCILVPRHPGLTEWHHLPTADHGTLMSEIETVSLALLDAGARKINVGSLGNLVPQLHIHVVGRHPDDAAWPGPVWGSGRAEPYDPAALRALAAQLRAAIFAPHD